MTKDDLLALLSQHIGAENGLPAQCFAVMLGIHERQIRKFVTELRENGVAVCGTPQDGYFIAATAEELEATCQFLRSRSMHTLRLEACMRKLPMPDLIGQLKLNT
ncbi:MAG: hypothetical protein AB1513_09835 [Pseudomonadota bacterium]